MAAISHLPYLLSVALVNTVGALDDDNAPRLASSGYRGMSRLALGLICGLIFAAVDVALMLPMSFPDKRTALLAAFFSRFGIGLVIPLVQIPSWPGWLIGLAFGLLLSLPDAIVTKAYAPILLSGAIGGVIIGGLTHGWGTPA